MSLPRSPARRPARPARAVLLFGSLMAAVVAVAGPAASPAAAAGDSPTRIPVTLTSQSWWVTPGQPFTLRARLGAGAPPASQLEVKVTLYNRLTARSTFAATLSGTPTGGVLDVAGPVADTGPGQEIAVSVPVDDAATAPPASGPSLDLGCEPGSCQGVYPLEVTVERVGTLAVVGRLLTYLTYDEADLTSGAAAGGPDALRVALVLPLSLGGAGAPARRVAPLGAVAQQLAGSPVPATVALPGRTEQALLAARGRGGPTGRAAAAALSALAALSADPAHQVPVPSYVPVDVGALAGGGIGGEVQAQVARGAAALSAGTVRTEPGTWLAGAPIGTDLAPGLGQVAAAEHVARSALHVVVPDTALAGTDDPATFSQPFTLELGNGASFTAAAADHGLSAHFTAELGDPVLGAAQLLADLSFIHDERPSLTAARGVVAEAPPGWSPDPAFVGAVLAGLAGNPLVSPVTVDTLFAQVPPGHNGSPATRRPATGGRGPAVTPAVARAVALGRVHLSGFDSAVSAPAVTGGLNDRLLSAEASTLAPAAQLAAVDAFEGALHAQLAQVRLATEQTVTLTSRNAPIPITVLSSAPYTVRAVLTVNSSKFTFPPPGSSRAIRLDHATNPEPVDAVARTSGDLPVSVTITSPRYGLVITRDELTVRSTATSVVGVVLTVGAVVVLLGWWARTWRRGRATRAARR